MGNLAGEVSLTARDKSEARRVPGPLSTEIGELCPAHPVSLILSRIATRFVFGIVHHFLE
jgi:hypothetical protein